jgi:hypothetical protein
MDRSIRLLRLETILDTVGQQTNAAADHTRTTIRRMKISDDEDLGAASAKVPTMMPCV